MFEKNTEELFNKTKTKYLKILSKECYKYILSDEGGDRLKSDILLQTNNTENMIYSHEGLLGNREIFFHDSYVRAKKLYEIFSPFSNDIKILIFIRNQDSFIESLYNQSIKEGGFEDFNMFSSRFLKRNLEWRRPVRGYTKVFGEENIFVVRYEEFLEDKNSVFCDIMNVVGVSFKLNIEDILVNPSISGEAIKKMIKINKKNINRHGKIWKNREKLQRLCPKSPGETFGLFSENRREKILYKYLKRNLSISDKYSIKRFK